MTSEYKNLWHVGGGFGNSMPKGTTVAQGVEASGIDFTVAKFPIMAVLPNSENPDDPHGLAIPGKCATVREDTGQPLGVVGDGYSIAQNSFAWVIPQILEDEGKFTFQSAGIFNGGARVMLTGTVADSVIRRLDGKPDAMSSQLVFSNGHNGKHSIIMGLSHKRHNCSNQNIAIMKGLVSEIRLSHTGNVEDRIAEAHSTFLIAFLNHGPKPNRSRFHSPRFTRLSIASSNRLTTPSSSVDAIDAQT